MPVTGHFHADKTGLFKGFILTPKFYFRHHQTFVVAMEFIHLEGMSAERNKIPVLVYHPGSHSSMSCRASSSVISFSNS